MTTYYKDQLNKLNPIDNISVKFYDSKQSTNNLTLNKESIAAIRNFLDCYEMILPEEK